MLLIYSVICLGLQIISWRVESIVATAVAVSITGFLLGPYFAAVSLLRAFWRQTYERKSTVLTYVDEGHQRGNEVASEEDSYTWSR
jgi:hypothetical protein